MKEPKFSITSRILRNVGQIEASREVIHNSLLVPLWKRRFQKEAIERTVHYATALEGNALNYQEVQKVLDKGRDHGVIARERDIQEVLNYRKAMEFINTLVERDAKIVREEHIKELNARITESILEEPLRGCYREVSAISRNSQTLEKSLKWPEPKKIPGLMGELCHWLEDDATRNLHPVIRAGIVHTWFVLIHPFSEGNGRTARILSTLSLSLDAYDVKQLFCLEEYYDHDAARYYAAIETVLNKDGDYTGWLEYFTTGLAIEFTRIKERVLKLSRDVRLKKNVGQVRLSPRQEKIIIFVNDYGQIKNNDWQELFPDFSDDTILRDIKELVKKGILVKKGRTKASRYELTG